jgi:hypothetical protein
MKKKSLVFLLLLGINLAQLFFYTKQKVVLWWINQINPFHFAIWFSKIPAEDCYTNEDGRSI